MKLVPRCSAFCVMQLLHLDWNIDLKHSRQADATISDASSICNSDWPVLYLHVPSMPWALPGAFPEPWP
jgi:hypothetical protein